MPYPRAFYQLQSDGSLTYQEQDTGVLDTRRLLSGQSDYWVSTALHYKEKQKKLLLASCFASTWSEDEILSILLRLGDLIDAGFIIYAWQDGQLKQLSAKTLPSLLKEQTFRQGLMPSDMSVMNEAAAKQHQITRDSLLVLDDHWLDSLLEGDEGIPSRKLSVHTFSKIPEELQIPALSWLKQAQPPLSTIILDELTLPAMKTLVWLRKQFPSATIEPIAASVMDRAAILDTGGYTQDAPCPVGYSRDRTVTHIISDDDIAFAIQTATTALRELDSLERDSPIATKIHTKLENFSLFPKPQNSQGFLRTRPHFASPVNWIDPQLELLIINRGYTANLSTLEPGSLPKLKEIHIKNDIIPSTDMSALLLAAHNVNKLLIAPCESLDWLDGLTSTSLASLRECHIEGRNLNTTQLMHLLTAAPMLEKLIVADITGEVRVTESLPSLRDILIVSASLSMPSVASLLTATTQLEKITIVNCSNLNTELSLVPDSLLSLKKIDIGLCPINTSSLATLLRAAPNIELLVISDCVALTGEITLEPASLASLMRITITESQKHTISGEFLIALQKAAPSAQIMIIWEGASPRPALQEIAPASSEVSTSIIDPPPRTCLPAKAPPPIDLPYNAALQKDFTPTPADAPFIFRGKNSSKNQMMIIEKLSQYLILRRPDRLGIIPKLQDGICVALKEFFIVHRREGWEQFISEISAWDGQEATISASLATWFEKLYGFVDIHHLNQAQYVQRYLGDDLASFLSSCPSPCRLWNLNHAIAIRRKEGSPLWEVYDPNFVEGVRDVPEATLLDTIQFAIGKIVHVESIDVEITPHVANKAEFIREGGLFTLLRCDNVAELLRTFEPVDDYPTAALEGLLLRDIKGIPAWVMAMQHPSTSGLTRALLQQFVDKNRHDYAHQLQQSMACLSPFQRLELSTAIIQQGLIFREESQPLSELLLDLVRSLSAAKKDYKTQIQTWARPTQRAMTTQGYCHNTVSSEVKKQLIECASANDCDALHYALQDYCHTIGRPIFYINSPNELVCHAPSFNAEGTLCKGPSGPLHAFLTTNPNGVLIVNYGAFKPDDWVRFNALLDKKRSADGTDVPESMMIIGLLNKDLPIAPGSDFFSRFNSVASSPLSSRQLEASVPTLPLVAEGLAPSGAAAAYMAIDVYHASEWESLLLGRWAPDAGRWHYEEGLLQRAIASGARTIEINNGLWENKDFCRFWRELAQSGVFHTPVGTVRLPQGMRFTQRSGYNWAVLSPILTHESALSATPHEVLNSETLNHFFGRYQVTGDGQLQHVRGYVAIAKTREPAVLDVHLTHALNEDQWARLLTTCRTEGVTLQLYCAPGVALPAPLLPAGFMVKPVPEKILGLPASHGVIQSTDVDTTVRLLHQRMPTALVLDVSECNASDLISRVKGGLINRKDEPLRFSFEQKACVLGNVPAGSPVILKGRVSPELAQQLAPLLLHYPNITLVSSDTSALSYLPRHQHTVTTAEKTQLLQQEYASVIPRIPTFKLHLMLEPLSKLITRCRFVASNPAGVNSNSAFAGLLDAPPPLKDPGIVGADSAAIATAFTEQRIRAVNAVLVHEPYVFLTGLSGVGKSTFVLQTFCQPPNALYVGESALADWAKPAEPGKRRILFIDEANLSPSEWSAFEGLFNDPPGILIDGQYYPLSAEHKVIFAGNPLSYGDERKLAPFFARHGNAVIFDPMPSAVLYEQVLKPVFEKTEPLSQASVISEPLLAVYRFLCQCSTTDILISPRELQMMALLTLSHCEQYPEANAEDIARHFAYELAKQLVPENQQAEFDHLFKPAERPAIALPAQQNDYLITPSRQPVYQLLDAFLGLQGLRHESSNEANNPAQTYGGLGGMLIEGEPGIGKSELVIAALRARGYEEIRDFSAPTTSLKPFYRMPVSMALSEKEALLRKAFLEGAVVIIDEINSSPMMERLLNALLMGTTPEGTPPQQPGFMVIGTQNPITMAGRRALSSALSRRMTTTTLPPYSENELSIILQAQGLPPHTAKALVDTFQEQVLYAKARRLTPPPTPRALFNLAIDIRKSELATKITSLSNGMDAVRANALCAASPAQSEPSSLIDIINTYFGNDTTKLGGLLGTYVHQVEQTPIMLGLFVQYLALSFGVDAAPEKMSPRSLFSELQNNVLTYHADPSAEHYHQLHEALTELASLMPANQHLQDLQRDLALTMELSSSALSPPPSI